MIRIQIPSFIQNYFDKCNIQMRRISSIATDSRNISTEIGKIFIPLPTNIHLDAIVENKKIVSIIEDNQKYNRNVSGKYDLYFNELDDLIFENDENTSLIYKPRWKSGKIRNFYTLNSIDAITVNRLCVVTGPAGGGKSILLQFLTLYLIRNIETSVTNHKKYSLSKQLLDELLIPLYIPLKSLAYKSKASDNDQLPTMIDLLNFLFGEDAVNNEHAIIQFLRNNNILFLFDGVDEIILAEDRERIINTLVSLAKRISEKARIVFSARDEIGYNWIPKEFVRFELTGLNSESRKQLSINTLIELGYTAIKAELCAKTLIMEIGGSKLDYELISNPLFFSLLISLFIKGGSLPSHGSELLDESIKLLIDRWRHKLVENEYMQKDKKNTVLYSYNFMKILEEIAYDSLISNCDLSQGSLEFSEAILNNSILNAISKEGNNGIDVIDMKNDVLSCLVSCIGIIKEGSFFLNTKKYYFSHRVFQMYLAANALSAPEFYKKTIAQLLFNRPWTYENVLLMLVEIMHDKEEAIELYNLVIIILEYLKDDNLNNYKELHTWLTWYMTRIISSRNYEFLSVFSKQYQYYNIENVLLTINAHVLKTIESKYCRMDKRVFCARYLCVLPQMIELMDLQSIIKNPIDQLTDKRYGIGLTSAKMPEIDWCHIEGGSFIMGLSGRNFEDVKELYPNLSLEREVPPCRVTVLPFEISRYPITNAQYRAFCEAGAYIDSHYWEWSDVSKDWFSNVGKNKRIGEILVNTDNSPVVNISWIEAKGFCEWLSEITGESIRLPYEHEWEYVSKRLYETYSVTDEFEDDIYISEKSRLQKCAPVGVYPYPKRIPSDLNGNVWEWTQTRIDEDESLSHFSKDLFLLHRSEYNNLSTHTRMVLRGGCYQNSPFMLRNTYRGRDYIYNHISNRQGFRIVQDIHE